MKKIIALLLITASVVSCANSTTDNGNAGDSVTTITSGNTDARQGQVIPTDSIEMSSDSTGNIHPADTTKK